MSHTVFQIDPFFFFVLFPRVDEKTLGGGQYTCLMDWKENEKGKEKRKNWSDLVHDSQAFLIKAKSSELFSVLANVLSLNYLNDALYE